MAEIKIKDLNALQQISKGQQEYQQKMTDYFKSSTNKFEEKIGTSESEAIKIYVEFLNEMKTNLTTKHPENIKKVSDVILKYYNSVTSATFSNDVISKNIDVYIGKTKGENVQQIVTPVAEAANYLSSITGSDYSIWGRIDEFNQEMGAISADISNKHEELTTYQITLKSELEESSILLEADKLYIQQVKTFASYDGRQAIDRIDALLRQGWTKDQIVQVHKNTTSLRDLKILSYLAESPPNYDNIVKTLLGSENIENIEDMKQYFMEQYLNGAMTKEEFDNTINLLDDNPSIFFKLLLGLGESQWSELEENALAIYLGVNVKLAGDHFVNALIMGGIVSGVGLIQNLALTTGVSSIISGVMGIAIDVIKGKPFDESVILNIPGIIVVGGCTLIGGVIGTIIMPGPGTYWGGTAGSITGGVINEVYIKPIIEENMGKIKKFFEDAKRESKRPVIANPTPW